MSLLVEYSDSESDVDSESEQAACPKKMKFAEKTDKHPDPKRLGQIKKSLSVSVSHRHLFLSIGRPTINVYLRIW